jgi:type II secretory pathway pseudopilin PulG
LTLIEALAATTVLSLASGAVLYAVVAGQRVESQSESAMRAAELAQDLMEDYLNGDAKATNGYSEAAGAIKNFNGELYPSVYQTFSRTLTLANTTQNVALLGGASPGVTATVTVTDSKGGTTTLTNFVPN